MSRLRGAQLAERTGPHDVDSAYAGVVLLDGLHGSSLGVEEVINQQGRRERAEPQRRKAELEVGTLRLGRTIGCARLSPERRVACGDFRS